jgi:lipopolysaccharide export system protein LptC
MHKRTAHRLRLSAVMAAGIVFALGSFWLVQVANRDDGALRADPSRNEPDYIVEHFSFVRMTSDGQPRYIVSGDKLTHRPIDDVSEVEQPVVRNLSAEQPPMTMTAQRARIDHVRNVVDLTGQVDLERAASKTAKGMTLKTEALTLLTDEDRMETRQPVELTSGRARLSGTGMRFDNATSRLDILSKMVLAYPPQPR